MFIWIDADRPSLFESFTKKRTTNASHSRDHHSIRSDVEENDATAHTEGAPGGEISKNALKKQMKAAENAKKKAEKEQAKAEKASAAASSTGGAGGDAKKQKGGEEEEEEELDPSKYLENRTASLDALVKSGQIKELYPHKFQTTISIPDFVEAFKSLPEGGELGLGVGLGLGLGLGLGVGLEMRGREREREDGCVDAATCLFIKQLHKLTMSQMNDANDNPVHTRSPYQAERRAIRR